MDKHITILGTIYIVWNAMTIGAGMLISLVLLGGGLIAGDDEAFLITSVVGLSVGSFMILLALPGVIGGIGLLHRRNWARILLIILGILNLPGFPFGTALGIYTLWVLFQDETLCLLPSPATA
ncbi:MAG: hypothetical protein JXQ27_16330 [Acidobacteria bacterium]|nr:hypothetical protein [Acidobacteriota bacterium]